MVLWCIKNGTKGEYGGFCPYLATPGLAQQSSGNAGYALGPAYNRQTFQKVITSPPATISAPPARIGAVGVW